MNNSNYQQLTEAELRNYVRDRKDKLLKKLASAEEYEQILVE